MYLVSRLNQRSIEHFDLKNFTDFTHSLDNWDSMEFKINFKKKLHLGLSILCYDNINLPLKKELRKEHTKLVGLQCLGLAIDG